MNRLLQSIALGALWTVVSFTAVAIPDNPCGSNIQYIVTMLDKVPPKYGAPVSVGVWTNSFPAPSHQRRRKSI
uniref:Uncharacterized protein n=1 Tax=Candidatus Kentrum sp. FM TaxID=2126340 RepID=A0A450SL38_9GAMM|nr:MAG: hypothetical protein BECKFM1743C_GA0114222_101379 [Candidatus Kentron sp. FM]VFK10225.1 MAG: hypothetical protein BECKFM1743B_GA0114221_1013310 [Candidatus Kentron sp. FM]